MNALFVVEPDFLTAHVGVRRVIIHYISALEKEGAVVALGAPNNGVIELLRLGVDAQSGETTLAWSGDRATPSDYTTTVITNPWLCARGLPELPGCIGIIYDLVPNLLASGCLRFSSSTGIFQFAHEHDIGFRYYLQYAKRITCISASTRQDLLDLYGPVRRDLIVTTHVPFEVDDTFVRAPRANSVLLVNVLDARKNFKQVAGILIAAYQRKTFNVNVVGRERTSAQSVLDFFARLTDAGIPHQWHRNADDAQLDALYQQSAVLLFPSLYEGLGLPVLEAQQAGVPTITTNVSSLPEINLNPTLCFAPTDVTGMSEAIVNILSGTQNCLSGEKLRQALVALLATQPSAASIFV